MKLILTEKPSQAADIAKAIGEAKKENGFFACNGYSVTWAIGHLYKLDDEEYSGKWVIEELPLIPENFNSKPLPDKLSQVKIIFSLISKAEMVIVATDAGREGELIAREILNDYKGKLPPCFRLWTSEALTGEVVRKQLSNLKPLSQFDSLYFSAKARQESDWLVGINLTRLFSVKANSKWTIGRVQTPSLNLIVSRFREIENFTPVPFSTIETLLSKDDTNFSGKVFNPEVEQNPDRFSLEEATKLLEDFKSLNTSSATVQTVSSQSKSIAPPSLYSLTQLQRAANRKYGLSAQETLDIAQKLYETHKCLSYPRTDSTHLAESSKEMARELLSFFAPELTGRIDSVGKRVFDDSKLTDHHALLPLKNYPGDNRNESQIFDLVKFAFIAAFHDSFTYEETRATLSIQSFQHPILVTGKKTVNLGWKSVYKQISDEEEPETFLPKLKQGDRVNIVDFAVKNSKTTPPSHFTEDSLLGAMQKLNLGTPPTRAPIIEKLIDTAYIYREKKNLLPTKKGIELIDILKDSQIVSPEMTGTWEEKLDLIYKKNAGFCGYSTFVQDIKDFTVSQVNRYKEADIETSREATPKMIAFAKKLAKEYKTKDFDPKATDSETVKQFIDNQLNREIACPCGNGKIEISAKAFSCKSCDRTIWKEVAGKKLTLDNALDLLKGKTVKMKGFKSKAGKKFDAGLKLVDGKTTFVFDK